MNNEAAKWPSYMAFLTSSLPKISPHNDKPEKRPKNLAAE